MLIGWLVNKTDLLVDTQKGIKRSTVRGLNFNPFSFLFDYNFIVFFLIGINKIDILDRG